MRQSVLITPMETEDTTGLKGVGGLEKKNACEQVGEPHSVAAAALKRNTIPLVRKKLGAASERAEKREL